MLIVEDNKNLRQIIKETLSEKYPDIVVQEAESVEKARSIIASNLPGLVLVDIMLPGENGLTFTREIKSKNPKTVVIIMTSYDTPEYREAAVNCGADYFISKKHINPVDLVDVINSFNVYLDGNNNGSG